MWTVAARGRPVEQRAWVTVSVRQTRPAPADLRHEHHPAGPVSRCLHRQGGGSAHDGQGKALHLFDPAAPGPSYAPAAAPTSGRRYPSPTARSPAGPGVHTELLGQAEGEDGARGVTHAGWRSTARVRTTPAGPRATRSTRTAASGLPSPDWPARRPVVADVADEVLQVGHQSCLEQGQPGGVGSHASNTRCHGDPQSAVGGVGERHSPHCRTQDDLLGRMRAQASRTTGCPGEGAGGVLRL